MRLNIILREIALITNRKQRIRGWARYEAKTKNRLNHIILNSIIKLAATSVTATLLRLVSLRMTDNMYFY